MGDDSDSNVEAVKNTDDSLEFEAAEDYFNSVKADSDYFIHMLDLVKDADYVDEDTRQKIISQAKSENKLAHDKKGKKRDKKRKAVDPIVTKPSTQMQADSKSLQEPESIEGGEGELQESLAHSGYKKGKKRKAVDPVVTKPSTPIQAPMKSYLAPEEEGKGDEEEEEESLADSGFTEIKPPEKKHKSGPSPKKKRKDQGTHANNTKPAGSKTTTEADPPAVADVNKTVHVKRPKDTKSSSSSFEERTNQFWMEVNTSKLVSVNGSGSPDSSLLDFDREEKREKLRAKIAVLQAKRNLKVENKHELRQLRREKRLKQKQRRKEMKQTKGKPGEGGTANAKPETETKGGRSNSVYNSEGKLVFSKFDFTPSKREKSKLTGKDYKRLLETVEKRNQKIKKLKSTDESKARVLQDKFKWEAALQKAEGQKVKDDPELLKKALKRKDKSKERKKKKWAEREAFTKKLMDDKQAKRKHNIQARKQAKLESKIKRAKKKGRMLPGF